ncbi:hypothetical protein PCYB_125400 [Plasmodium cynomolgi strain B]|uniref:Uncharacterized protein n=1 Tax=Plasmodium cynomolgi (strain B) TaxID=1120755 RepID=K6UWF1_PLACD|nr:hypothetical protein PCYB_125400 [Plasmodium cynomolgi strain B]GAB67974.1 hypothetical protein PCYB_125400 [Plasmodium cynomolgi strain B]
MKGDTQTNYHFSVKNVNFFKSALALLSVDDSKGSNSIVRKGTTNQGEVENCILFNLFGDGLMLRSWSKCKQIYCFLFLDSDCFTSYGIGDNGDKHWERHGEKRRRRTSDSSAGEKNAPCGCHHSSAPSEGACSRCHTPKAKRCKREYKQTYSEEDSHEDDTNSVNSDNLYTTHAINMENNNLIKLKAVSPLKVKPKESNKREEENEDEYFIRKKIYEKIDEEKNNSNMEFLVCQYELLRAMEFLDPILLNIKFDYPNRKLILHLTDEDGDTSETFVRIIVDYYYEISKLEKYTFLQNDYNFFSILSATFSFYLDYLIKSSDQYITFYITEYCNDSTTVLKMETKNKNYQRSVQLMPKENFQDFKSSKSQMYTDGSRVTRETCRAITHVYTHLGRQRPSHMLTPFRRFKYRIRDLSKINQALSKAKKRKQN